MKVTTLQNLLIEELKDLYSAEKQLTKALPKMLKKASAPKLKKAIEKHHAETEKQVERLEQVFELLGEKPRAKKCLAMEGLINEAQELMKEDIEPDVLDAGLIAAAQKVEHYEIASYGTVRTYASLLGNSKAAKLLQKTLDEEGKTDQLLTQLAESSINLEAINEEEEQTGSSAATTRRGRSAASSNGNGRSSAKTGSGTKRGRTAENGTAKNSTAKNGAAKKKQQSRRKPAPTRTEDLENYELMTAGGTTTGVTVDTTGNDAQNSIYSDSTMRNRQTDNQTDVERQTEQEPNAYNER